MNTQRLKQTAALLTADGLIEDVGALLIRRYFNDWMLSDDPEHQRNLHLKTRMVEEIAAEFAATLEPYRETGE